MNFGVICELNPLHAGHKYLFDKCKENSNALICAMSGSFTQRGDFAVYNKYDRAQTAIENGADLVIEIPALCTIQSAQGYAKAGVSILEATGVCDFLAFGAETDDIEKLRSVSKQIQECDKIILDELAKGVSYPKARQRAVNSPILETPNNILAIEYLTYTKLNAIAIKRIGKGHDTDDINYSASEIRRHLSKDEIHTLENCEKAVLYKLRNMSSNDFLNITDVSEGLENRIEKFSRQALSLEELYDSIKTKRYTHSRIRRIILRAFLGITKDMPTQPEYLHILAFNDTGRQLLSQMRKTSTMPIITKYSNITDERTKELYDLECKFTDIYNLGLTKPLPCGEEQRAKVRIL